MTMSNLFIETQKNKIKEEDYNRNHMGFHRHQNRIRYLEEKGKSEKKREKK